MNDDGGGEVARAFFFSPLSANVYSLSHSHADCLSRTLYNSLSLSLCVCVCVCLSHARTVAPHKISPPSPSLTTDAESVLLLLLLLLLLLQNYYYTKYYYTHPSLDPSTASPHERGSLTRGSLSAATNDGGRRQRPLMKK